MTDRRKRVLSVLAGALCVLLATAVAAQDRADQNSEPSLGDFARDLRRNKAQEEVQQAQPAPPPPVIDNDNLSEAIADVRRVKNAEKIVFSIDPDGRRLRLSSPDASCSLAFNGRSTSLLFQPALIEDLPLADLLRIDGPGSIEDDTLQLDVVNNTEWELREVTVGITLERNAGANASLEPRARVIPAAENSGAMTVERRSDMTLLFHLKTDTKPFNSAIFRENIGITPKADEEWRWSIVSAKGIRAGAKASINDTAPVVPSLPLQSPSAPAASPASTPVAPGAASATSEHRQGESPQR